MNVNKFNLKWLIFVLLLMTLFSFAVVQIAYGEQLYVTATKLNGRAEPSSKASREAIFERSDCVDALTISNDGWVEVIGGETGTVWCRAEYLTSRKQTHTWKNTSGGSVKVRKEPSYESARVGKIKARKTVKVSAEVFGWGYIKDYGWIDLQYFSLED